MELTEEQKATITQWVNDGATLNQIQERLKDELELTITYLETRFLISDLGLELVEEEDETSEEQEASETETPAPESPDFEDPGNEAGTGSVSVTMDTVAIPGAMASGKVTFSDGQTAAWYLDQMGRLGLDPSEEGYRPSEEDVIAFQQELQKTVQ